MRFFTRPPVWGARGMRGEHREKAGGVPTSACRKVIYPSGVRGRWVALLVAVAATVLLAVVLSSRGAAAIAAGNVYSVLDGLAAPPARAVTMVAAPAKEQYLLPGQRVVSELGIEVIVPPLHHR